MAILKNATILLSMALLTSGPSARAEGVEARLKDLGTFRGVRTNTLTGYGLVVGLAGTGDGKTAKQTVLTLSNALARQGIHIQPKDLAANNVAAVMVTANLPPFARPGQRIDVQVASAGDAKSLAGGMLLRTELVGPDGLVYALGQGMVVVGGFAEARAGSGTKKNTPTSATIAGGAVIERGMGILLPVGGRMQFDLTNPDFTTAMRAAAAIDAAAGADVATPLDAATVEVSLPLAVSTTSNVVTFLASIESARVKTDTRARVVVSERTGTVVAGSDVRISPVLVAHGALVVEVREANAVSQPNPFSTGTTTPIANATVSATEERGKVATLGGEPTVAELATSLNELGATPRDLISLLEAIAAAGALNAELIVR